MIMHHTIILLNIYNKFMLWSYVICMNTLKYIIIDIKWVSSLFQKIKICYNVYT
jgi:hypothetical protein